MEYVATAYFASLSASSIIAGALADATRRPGLLASLGLLANGVSILLMPRYTGFEEMLLIRVLQGTGLSTAIPVSLGSLSMILGEAWGVGATALFTAAGMALGSLTGGLIISFLGYDMLFLVSGLLSILAALAVLGIPQPPGPTRMPRPSDLARALRGRVGSVLVGIFLRQSLATGVYAALSIILSSVLGLSLLETAAALTINPVVQGFVSLLIPRWVGRLAGPMYGLGIALTGVVFLMLAESQGSPHMALAAMALQGVAFGLVNTSGNYIVIEGLPREIRYTASSLFSIFFNLGWIVGTALAGVALSRVSPGLWLEITGVMLGLLGLVYVLLLLPKPEEG